jgi:hypothetical protein
MTILGNNFDYNLNYNLIAQDELISRLMGTSMEYFVCKCYIYHYMFSLITIMVYDYFKLWSPGKHVSFVNTKQHCFFFKDIWKMCLRQKKIIFRQSHILMEKIKFKMEAVFLEKKKLFSKKVQNPTFTF